ncbi:TIGR03084 family metal-binding protein [Rhodococcus koreensis]
MIDPRYAVLDDLAAESEWLDSVLAALPTEHWHRATPAVNWDIAHQVAHLTHTDEAALATVTGHPDWQQFVSAASANPLTIADITAAAGASVPVPQLMARWRRSRRQVHNALTRAAGGTKYPWFGPPMSVTSMATARLMETWAHGRDITDALDICAPRTDRIRHILLLGALTRRFSFINRGLPAPAQDVHLSLTMPSGRTWTHGPIEAPAQVHGSAYDFALLVTRRRHRQDLDLTTTGPDVEQWLDIAQAYAGPPGPGRQRTTKQ